MLASSADDRERYEDMMHGVHDADKERLRDEAEAVRLGLITREEVASMPFQDYDSDDVKASRALRAEDEEPVTGKLPPTDSEDEGDEVGHAAMRVPPAMHSSVALRACALRLRMHVCVCASRMRVCFAMQACVLVELYVCVCSTSWRCGLTSVPCGGKFAIA
jgi:hypothetical protein